MNSPQQKAKSAFADSVRSKIILPYRNGRLAEFVMMLP